jgi:hypothetical protein
VSDPSLAARFVLSDPTADVDDPENARSRRKRSVSPSWLLKCLCEKTALAANHEDDISGRFWAGRFKSVALSDEAAVLA